jgi:outer membrane protein assembly factor BamB
MTATPSSRAHRIVIALAGAAAFAATATGRAADGDATWPHWRGVDRTGVSAETGWSDTGRAEDVWKKELGRGYASVVIGGGRLYTTGHDEETGRDTLYCLDVETGEEIWTQHVRAKLDALYHGGGTLSTPSLDGDVVYLTQRDGKVACFDASTGEPRWHANLAREHDLERPTWGVSASPLVLDEMVVISMGKVFALDKKTGKPKWTTPRDFGHVYATPVDCTINGKRRIAVMAGDGLVILDRATGEPVALHPWKTKYDINASTPIVIDDRVFISSGYNHGCAMVDVGQAEPRVVWESKVMRTKMTGCVLWEDHLYGFDESVLKCVDLDGNEKWKKRGLGMGALMIADGKLILLSGKGELIVADASPEGYDERSRQKVLDGGVYWTSPVLLDGRIYCRNSLGQLVCRDHRPAGSGS